MQVGPVAESVDFVEKSGLIGVLVAIIVFIIWTGFRGQWVFGWAYKDMKADRDEWKATAMRLIRIDSQLKALNSVEPPE